MHQTAIFCSLLLTLAGVHAADKPMKSTYPPQLEGAVVETYKTVGEARLNVWIFSPKDKSTPRPAVVFFFGGGWTSGTPAQFEKQCRHFAERGIVAITADYRVASRHKIKPAACVADAKSCIRWVRTNAKRLGIDPDRIVASGGSAGGHLAAATALLPGLDEPGEDTSVSAAPNALILFNPVLILGPVEGQKLNGFGSGYDKARFGCEPKAISPFHHIKKGVPPTLILHGKADTTVPFADAETFAHAMKESGNRCELIGYDAQPHGFFNSAKYEETLGEADKFLISLQYLTAAKKIDPTP